MIHSWSGCAQVALPYRVLSALFSLLSIGFAWCIWHPQDVWKRSDQTVRSEVTKQIQKTTVARTQQTAAKKKKSAKKKPAKKKPAKKAKKPKKKKAPGLSSNRVAWVGCALGSPPQLLRSTLSRDFSQCQCRIRRYVKPRSGLSVGVLSSS